MDCLFEGFSLDFFERWCWNCFFCLLLVWRLCDCVSFWYLISGSACDFEWMGGGARKESGFGEGVGEVTFW